MNPMTISDRRQFLHSTARYTLLLGLGGLAVAGEAKRRRLENDPNCIRTWSCADCIEFGRCAKPKAQETRLAQMPKAGLAARLPK